MMTIGVSTSHHAKAFIAAQWKNRDQMDAAERRGFMQFVYVAVLGHLEETLAKHIQARLRTLSTGFIEWRDIGHIESYFDGKPEQHNGMPLGSSILKILGAISDDLGKAALSNLTGLHDRVFSKPIVDRIGKDLNDDLVALGNLRNIFAHGRDMLFGFPEGIGKDGNLDGNPLKKPVERLYHAGVVKQMNYTTMNYDQIMLALYEDDALRYFYEKAKAIEKALFDSIDYPPEKYQVQPAAPFPALDS